MSKLERLVLNKINKMEDLGVWLNTERKEEYIKSGLKAISEMKDNDSYGKDSRSMEEMYSNLIATGWIIEDTFKLEMEDGFDFIINENGSDSERVFGGKGNYTTEPDFITEKGVKIELQCSFYGEIKMKYGKIKNNIENKSNIVIKLLDNKYILLDVRMMERIMKLEQEVLYHNKNNPKYNKMGWKFFENDFNHLTMKQLVEKLKG